MSRMRLACIAIKMRRDKIQMKSHLSGGDQLQSLTYKAANLCNATVALPTDSIPARLHAFCRLVDPFSNSQSNTDPDRLIMFNELTTHDPFKTPDPHASPRSSTLNTTTEFTTFVHGCTSTKTSKPTSVMLPDSSRAYKSLSVNLPPHQICTETHRIQYASNPLRTPRNHHRARSQIPRQSFQDSQLTFRICPNQRSQKHDIKRLPLGFRGLQDVFTAKSHSTRVS
jgi:hypothetical protein